MRYIVTFIVVCLVPFCVSETDPSDDIYDPPGELNIESKIATVPALENAPRYPSSRVVNGREAYRGQFPYQAGIYLDWISFCGGSLISSEWVLTAGHCCEGTETMYVYLGVQHMNVTEPGRVIMASQNFTIHPGYNRSHLNNDVCVVKLPKPVDYTVYIQPIGLVPRALANSSFTNQTARSSGWGLTSDNGTNISQTLRYVDFRMMSLDECHKTYSNLWVQNYSICGQGSNGANVCEGDSGGPLVLRRPVRFQIGINSFVSTRGCDYGDPTVFSRVGYFLDWISDETGLTFL